MKNIKFLILLASIIIFNISLAQVTETKLLPSDPENIGSFGSSVAMDGNVLIVGCGDANYLGPKTGVALIFHNSDGEWVEDSILMPGDWTDGARFGWSVDVQDDYIFIGALHDGANGLWAGAVYVFKHDPLNSVWVQHQKLVSSDINIGDEFGVSVSVSDDHLLVGAMGDESHIGAAYVFKKNGSDWVEEAKLLPLNYTGDEPYFGESVSLDGNYAIVGAPLDDSYENEGGSAFIFHFDGSNWIQQGKLISSDINSSDYFGSPVSISGDYAMVGAVNAINQTIRCGAVYVFNRNGVQWTEQQKLFDNDATVDIAFGKAISVQGDYAVVGVPEDIDLGSNAGAVFIYENNGSNWVKIDKLHASDGQESDKLGWSVDIDNGRATAGAVLQYAGGDHCGAVYIFEDYASAIPEAEMPLEFEVFPNPSTGTTCLGYLIHDIGSLGSARDRYLISDLFGIDGRKIRRISEEKVQPGEYEVFLDVSDLPAGVYFIRVQAGEKVGVKKLIVSD